MTLTSLIVDDRLSGEPGTVARPKGCSLPRPRSKRLKRSRCCTDFVSSYWPGNKWSFELCNRRCFDRVYQTCTRICSYFQYFPPFCSSFRCTVACWPMRKVAEGRCAQIAQCFHIFGPMLYVVHKGIQRHGHAWITVSCYPLLLRTNVSVWAPSQCLYIGPSPTDSPTAVAFFGCLANVLRTLMNVLWMSCDLPKMFLSQIPKLIPTLLYQIYQIPSHSISIPMGSSKPGTRRHGGGAGRAGRAGRATPREARWDLHKHLASYLPYIHLDSFGIIW